MQPTYWSGCRSTARSSHRRRRDKGTTSRRRRARASRLHGQPNLDPSRVRRWLNRAVRLPERRTVRRGVPRAVPCGQVDRRAQAAQERVTLHVRPSTHAARGRRR